MAQGFHGVEARGAQRGQQAGQDSDGGQDEGAEQIAGSVRCEQVWDRAAPAGAIPGEPTGSATPLLWSHAEFLKLLYARKRGRPIEQLDVVRERYEGNRPQADVWHWPPDAPFAVVPRGRDARIELRFRFRLRFGVDGWRQAADLESEPQGLGLYGVQLDADVLGVTNRIDFTYWNQESKSWADADWAVTIRQ